jgi:hypothetical protein
VQGQITLAHAPSLRNELGLGDIHYITYISDITYIGKAILMAGRPKREEDVTSILLRIPPALLKRVQQCQALLQLQTGASVTRTAAFWRILEAGCDALEGTLEGREVPAPVHIPISKISEISSLSISKISEISGEDLGVPGFGFPEDETEPLVPVVAGPQTAEAPAHHGRPGISHETLQAIADEHTLCEGLNMREFAERLFAKGIYRARAKDGREVPVDHSRLRRWLEQAREQGLL